MSEPSRTEAPRNVQRDRRRASRRKGGLATLAQLIPRTLPKDRTGDGTFFRVVAEWERSAPPRLVQAARPVALRGTTLTIHTTTAGWAHEVSLRSPELLAMLGRALRPGRITTLRAKVGPVPERIVPVREKPRAIEARALPLALLRTLESVHDASVRTALARAAAVSLSDP